MLTCSNHISKLFYVKIRPTSFQPVAQSLDVSHRLLHVLYHHADLRTKNIILQGSHCYVCPKKGETSLLLKITRGKVTPPDETMVFLRT